VIRIRRPDDAFDIGLETERWERIPNPFNHGKTFKITYLEDLRRDGHGPSDEVWFKYPDLISEWHEGMMK
jgi:hypothetical protein